MKKFEPTQQMINAAENTFLAMAMTDTIRPIVEAYQRKILNQHRFHISKKWVEKGIEDCEILDPRETYLLEATDFQVYFDECNEAREAAKLHVKTPGHCPLLVAEYAQLKAEIALIDSMEPVTGVKYDQVSVSLENRAKYLDLTLKLLAPFVGNSESILKKQQVILSKAQINAKE